MKDKIHMNDYYYEPEIYTVGDLNDLDNIDKEFYNNSPTKSEELLNQEIENDYHNTYYSKGKYGHRQIKMKNSEYLKLNKL